MKGLRVTKIVKKINFEEVGGVLEVKGCFQRQSFTKYLRNSSFPVKWPPTEKAQFLFFKSFWLALKNFSF